MPWFFLQVIYTFLMMHGISWINLWLLHFHYSSVTVTVTVVIILQRCIIPVATDSDIDYLSTLHDSTIHWQSTGVYSNFRSDRIRFQNQQSFFQLLLHWLWRLYSCCRGYIASYIMSVANGICCERCHIHGNLTPRSCPDGTGCSRINYCVTAWSLQYILLHLWWYVSSVFLPSEHAPLG